MTLWGKNTEIVLCQDPVKKIRLPSVILTKFNIVKNFWINKTSKGRKAILKKNIGSSFQPGVTWGLTPRAETQTLDEELLSSRRWPRHTEKEPLKLGFGPLRRGLWPAKHSKVMQWR